ncbi:MAG: hypothetical protein M1833_004897 [Piccolia ochrophora]|nr:MAG: hypothetical protein M1833_004897 [Piccolia ochrophora]
MTNTVVWVPDLEYHDVVHGGQSLLPSNFNAEEQRLRFYSLSKTHHPDRNPNDPTASTRFVNISEAYAVLGSPQKRERYDRDLARSRPQSGRHHHPRGSHASTTGGGGTSAGPAGGRPASGLSRRRTQFRGPPPSFYRSGGWGKQSAKRREGASAAASAGGGAEKASEDRNAGTSGAAGESSGSGSGRPEGSETAGGFGPAWSQAGEDYDVPHFDRQGHFRTQEEQDRRRQQRIAEGFIPFDGGGSTLVNFLFVGGIVFLGVVVPTVVVDAIFKRGNEKEDKRAR